VLVQQAAWVAAPTVSIIRFISSKFAIITPALITGALLNDSLLGLLFMVLFILLFMHPYVI
jgi:ammonia channel protein AmtB